MPALPWTQRTTPDPNQTYVTLATRLPLRRYRAIPAFLRDTMRIRRQLRDAPGLVGYTLKADLFTKTFWTYSVWTDDAQLRAFSRAEPHRGATRRQRPEMMPSVIRTGHVQGDAVRRSWRDIQAELTGAVRTAAGTGAASGG